MVGRTGVGNQCASAPLPIGQTCTRSSSAPAPSPMPAQSSEPVAQSSSAIAQSRPKSPTRLARKAFLPAAALASSAYQKPMSR